MNAIPTDQRPCLRGDEAVLFAEHHDRLVRSVRRAVNAPDALIEDACATAWVQLMRAQPDRGPTLFGWLRTTAIREAYRLSSVQRRDAALEELVSPNGDCESRPDGWEALIADDHDPDSHLEALRALRALASLPERERRYLALLVAGYRYREIVALTGATYTNVNKHLVRARARVREIQAADHEASERRRRS